MEAKSIPSILMITSNSNITSLYSFLYNSYQTTLHICTMLFCSISTLWWKPNGIMKTQEMGGLWWTTRKISNSKV